MEQLITGVVILCAGVAIIIFRRKIVNEVINLNNNEGFGFMHYGERERKIGLWQVPIFGILFIIWGVLTMLGVLN